MGNNNSRLQSGGLSGANGSLRLEARLSVKGRLCAAQLRGWPNYMVDPNTHRVSWTGLPEPTGTSRCLSHQHFWIAANNCHFPEKLGIT